MSRPFKKQIIINGRFLTQRKTGVQRFAYEIILRLINRNLDVLVLIPNCRIFDGYNVTDWPIQKVKGLQGHLWEQISLPAYLLLLPGNKKNKILLNLCNTGPLLFSNKITAIHDLAVIVNPSWFNRKFRILYRFLLPRLVRSSKRLITVSHFSKSQLEDYFPKSEGKIEVVYNGATPNLGTSNDNKLLTNFGLNKNEYILGVSSIEPRKNLERLISAYRLLDHNKVKLVLVGSKGKSFNHIDLNTTHPGIILAGYVNDQELSSLYRNAICFVYPSLYEGFGIPPIEAMNSGCPTIVSDIPALREVASDAVLYVDPHNIEDIADKIGLLIKDTVLSTNLRCKGYKRAALFDWQLAARKVEKILAENSAV